jgi:adenosylcobinamide-phosphate synthase
MGAAANRDGNSMSAALLLPALLLDAALGEPKWLWDKYPHPAVLMGRAVGWADKALNRGENRRNKGIAAMVMLGLGAWMLGTLIAVIPDFGLLEIICAAMLLAQKSLVDHVRAVADSLRQSLPAGRRAVAMIVGRDTKNLDAPAISRAAIESAAENLSDGVIAPAFWFLILGLPGLMLYKITNTADSMIGHRTPKYEQFGWAAARFDDLLNWVPARITAALIAISHLNFDPAPILRDAPLHRSPNAGWPEAAMAVVLNTSLSGPRSYDGKMQDFPWVWPEGNRSPTPETIDAACSALWRAWGLMLLAVAVLASV